MLIKKVRIENFKCIESREVEIRPFDCLVGPNNSGKTTLLQALALFDFCAHLCISRRNGTVELLRKNVSPEDFYVLPVSSPVDLWTDKKTQARGKHQIIRVTMTFDNGYAVTAALDLTYNIYHFSLESDEDSGEWLKSLSSFRISYLPVFSTFLPQEERRTPAVIEDSLVRGRVNSVIRNLLLNLKHEHQDAALVETLRRSFPSLKDMGITFDETSDRYIAVTYKEEEHAKEFDIFSAGSGFQQFLYLFGFITLRQPDVILLDEPDVHLHGVLQRTLLDELRRLVAGGKQILFATHSRDLISQMGPDEILTLEDGGIRRLSIASDIYDTLDRLGSLDSTQLPTVQAFRRVLIVEDEKDRDILFSFCATLLEPSVWQQVKRRLAVCFAKGNPARQDMPRLQNQLQQMITLKGHPLEMFIVADRDYHPDIEYLRKSMPGGPLHWHIWERTEIENYLLSTQGILRTLGPSDPQMRLDEPALEAEMEKLVLASRNNANDRLVKAFQEYGRSRDERWDAATLSRKAREYLDAHWETERLALADAKDVVLPGIKRWLQDNHFGQFSDKKLADVLQPDDLPTEIHDLVRELAAFAGVMR